VAFHIGRGGDHLKLNCLRFFPSPDQLTVPLSTPHSAEPPTAFFQHPFTNILFEKLREPTFSFVMPVRQSAWNNLVTTALIFMKFDI
jgi:hypothetical protein